MAGTITLRYTTTDSSADKSAIAREPLWLRWVLIGATVLFLGVFLILPVAAVFGEALQQGARAYFASFTDPDFLSSVWLTLFVAAIVVPLNTLFGLAAAWSIARFEFKGKSFLITLIDLPFAVSPVIAGLVFVLLFGLDGYFGPWLLSHNIHIIFATPGIVLATIFVAFPFVARVLIPLMQNQGKEEELAALTLGATGLQTFWRITLPNIKWALLYGVILCNARAMGEFGAVTVVSGHIAGLTNTMPLQVEQFWDDYQFVPAFTLASLLVGLALVTLVIKEFIEWRTRVQVQRSEKLTLEVFA
jgi:sulfate/thiosulfate transport system permease protein